MAKLPNVSELKECPHCGSQTYHYHSAVSGHITNWFNFDGTDADSTEMYSSMNSKALKFVYCANCHEKIARNDSVN